MACNVCIYVDSFRELYNIIGGLSIWKDSRGGGRGEKKRGYRGKAAGGDGESGLMVPSGAVSKPGTEAAQGDREKFAELLMSSPTCSLSLGC